MTRQPSPLFSLRFIGSQHPQLCSSWTAVGTLYWDEYPPPPGPSRDLPILFVSFLLLVIHPIDSLFPFPFFSPSIFLFVCCLYTLYLSSQRHIRLIARHLSLVVDITSTCVSIAPASRRDPAAGADYWRGRAAGCGSS